MKYILFLLCILFLNSSVWAADFSKTKPAQNFPTLPVGNLLQKSSGFGSTDTYSGKTNTPTYAVGNTRSPIDFDARICSIINPQNCLLPAECRAAQGYWNESIYKCERTICPIGTIEESLNPGRCKCTGNSETYAFVERGNFLQRCPSECLAAENKTYSFDNKSCVCSEGFTLGSNGVCNRNPAPAAPDPTACLSELAEKANTCETESNRAASQCDAGQGDSLSVLQGFLANTAQNAKANCEQAGTASSSGYFEVSDKRKLCDERINTCKSNCTEATAFLNSNKERVFMACREAAYQAQQGNGGAPVSHDVFNAAWQTQVRPTLENQFQSYLAKADGSRVSCESGTVAQSREKLSTSMADMNNTAKTAEQCVCQLNSKTADCTKPVGPADCSADPTLAGCAKVVENCFDVNNTSAKCICFRNPESSACKELTQKNSNANENLNSAIPAGKLGIDARGDGSGTSQFAGGTPTSGEPTQNLNVKSDINAGVNLPPEAASGSAISSASNTSEAQTAASPSAAGSPSGRVNSVGGKGASDASVDSPFGVAKKINGMFETAKSALGGMLKKGSKSGDTSGDYKNDNAKGSFDAKKFRPRGMVRGIASESEIAGKYEDIWKVMSKQYKVQDQKDKFLFDVNK